MWMGDQQGYYTVKSGYLALQNWKKEDADNPSTSDPNLSTWKKFGL